MYKGLCQNKKHGFDQYTKGGHFCAAHMALSSSRDVQAKTFVADEVESGSAAGSARKVG